MSKTHINIGWNDCPVYEDLKVKQCNNCLIFGHRTNECKKESVCLNCLGPHSNRQCTINVIPKCYNCIFANEKFNTNREINHDSLSYNCCTYKVKLAELRSRIDYS